MAVTNVRERARLLLVVAFGQQQVKDRLATHLKEWRGSLGPPTPPQEAVARRYFNVSTRQYARWEGAESLPRPANLETICDIIGIEIAALYDDRPHAESFLCVPAEMDNLGLRSVSAASRSGSRR